MESYFLFKKGPSQYIACNLHLKIRFNEEYSQNCIIDTKTLCIQKRVYMYFVNMNIYLLPKVNKTGNSS